MVVRAREEDDAWGIDDQRTGVGVGDGQSSLFEDVKVAGMFVEGRRDAAEGSGKEHAGGEGESFEEWGKAIHISIR